jgi:uncharacterized protein (TIGR03118 family)
MSMPGVPVSRLLNVAVAALTCLASAAIADASPILGFTETTLRTNLTDPDLVNPWGISSSPTSPFWVSDNGSGKATLYNSAGVKQGLIVSMPAGSEAVTGQVFANGAAFNGDAFLFATEGGTITGWRGALGTNAEVLFTVTDANYKGLAISAAKDQLFAANFAGGTIDVFNSAGRTGSFSDSTVPAGYKPFNVQNLNGTIYVTYALRDQATGDDVEGAGHGFVDTFDPITHVFTRIASQGPLDSPWGLALAPAGFDSLGGDLLVGNFGDGLINAFTTGGLFLGTLADPFGALLENAGLWGLQFGNGGNGGLQNSLYLAAGGADETSGLFARIDAPAAVPEPATFVLLGTGLLALRRARARRRL